MNDEKTNKIMSSEELDDVLPKYEPIKLSGKNLAQQYVSAFNTGMNIYQCVNYLQGNIDCTIKAVNDAVKSWNTEVSESIDQSKAIVRETTTEQFNTEWTNKQPELIEQVNTLTTNQFNNEKSIFNDELNALNSRMDTFTNLPEGSTTGDAELQDIRVGANGVTYPNAGDAVRGQYSQLKEDLVEITETTEKKIVLEEHPTKNNGYYWNGVFTNSSYFYYHLDVKEGDVVTIPLSISAEALQEIRFIDAYKGTERNADASIQTVSRYVVPKDVDNIYLSVNFRQDYYEYYYVSILRAVEELKPKGISDLTNRVSVLENVIVETKNGYTLKKEMDNLASGSLITLSEHIDIKKNKSYRFSAKFDTFSSVTIGHGYNVYSGSWITVDNTNVTAYYYDGSKDVQMGQYAHGLTISDFIDVVITVGNVENVRAVVTVMSVGGDFTQSNVPMAGCNGSVFAFGGQDLIDVVYSYNLADMLSDIWLFGDSYTSLGDPKRWTYQLMQYGYKDILMCGFSGATSSNEILAFREIMQIGKPKIVVWALGMNNADTDGSVNTYWKSAYDEVKTWCNNNSVELIACTIPNTPRVRNVEKNNIVRSSGLRYVDFAKAVNAEEDGATWYPNMLSSDNVHPIELGAKVLANRFLVDVPEVIN